MLLFLHVALAAAPALVTQDTTVAVEAPEAVEAAPPAVEAETGATAEEPTAPRLTTAADWSRWESLGRHVLSPDGRWVAYTIRRNDGTDELRLRVVATDSTEVFPQGGRPVFSKDAKWLAFSVTKSDDEEEKLKKAKKPVENDLGLFDLVRGERFELEGVRSFSFSGDGRYLAMQRHGEKGDEHGDDLVVRELETGLDTHYGRVGSHAWSDLDARLAITIDAPDQAGNSVAVLDAATGTRRTLDSAKADFLGLSWREDAPDLAVMRKTKYEDDEDPTFVVLAWRGLGGDKPTKTTYDHLADETFPADSRVVEHAGVRWSDAGTALFFGLQPWQERPKKLDEKEAEPAEDGAGREDPAQEQAGPDDATEEGSDAKSEKPEKSEKSGDEPAKSLRESLEKAPGVEVWHAKDVDIVPRQKVTESSDERRSDLVALWLDGNKIVRLEDELIEDAELLEGQEYALGLDETPYVTEQRFSATVADLYAIRVRTGEREKVAERVKYVSTGDPKGRYVLFVRDDHVWSYDLQERKQTVLTEGVDTSFIDRENSSLTDQKPMYGVAAWSQFGGSVLLYDRYDIWSLPLKGGPAMRLTQGADERIVHRRVVVSPEPKDEEFVDPEVGFHVSLYGDRSKKSGYGFLRYDAGVERYVYQDAQLGRLVRSESGDTLAFTAQRFDDSPDVFVAGPGLKDTKQVSATNAFAADFLWGRSELVDYENANGEALQGALFYPANYDPTKTYPMIVYIYELRSQSLHQYQSPSERNPYSTSVFTQDGYFVFQPDIVYRPQNPGLSAVECVVPAVRKVLERGRVDPERVGLVGHSWGAYQTAFIVTQTDLFAAGVAGAPLTNMMSMSMSIYWNSGQTDAWIFHESQGRMDRPFWRDVDTYIANSPIFSIEKLETPLLVAFGDKDGAVDWQQGVEMYNAARLAQRPFVMLVYPGENHGLAQEPNQVDYHHRVREWFGTHLKGEPAPRWVSDGIPWLEQKKALEAIGKPGKKGGSEAE